MLDSLLVPYFARLTDCLRLAMLFPRFGLRFCEEEDEDELLPPTACGGEGGTPGPCPGGGKDKEAGKGSDKGEKKEDFRSPKDLKTSHEPGEKEVREAAQKLFGRDVSDAHIAAMANATDGAKVSIKAEGGKLEVTAEGNGVKATRVIERQRAGLLGLGRKELVIRNEFLSVRKDSGHSGTELLKNQVDAARAAGVQKLQTIAMSSDDGKLNGGYTWARLGYSGTIEKGDFKKLPAEVQKSMGRSREVRDLMDKPGGAEAWKQAHGTIWNASFDVGKDSRNSKALDEYAAGRKGKAA